LLGAEEFRWFRRPLIRRTGAGQPFTEFCQTALPEGFQLVLGARAIGQQDAQAVDGSATAIERGGCGVQFPVGGGQLGARTGKRAATGGAGAGIGGGAGVAVRWRFCACCGRGSGALGGIGDGGVGKIVIHRICIS
jgi:hypothetical protein